MNIQQDYLIGDHWLRIIHHESHGFLEKMNGFIPFKTEMTVPVSPIVTVYADVPLDLWEQKKTPVNPLYDFEFDDRIPCTFSSSPDNYLLRMMTPEGKEPLLMEFPKGGEIRDVRSNVYNQEKFLMFRFALWMAYGIAASPFDTIAMHASVIIKNDTAILFLGESGTGKSTHSRLWLNHIPQSELLNDDSPIVRYREDALWAYGSPWSGKTPCYRPIRKKIGAFVRLNQAPENRIKPLKGIQALGALLPSCPPAFSYDPLLSDRIYNSLSKLLRHVPVYALDCLPEASAAELVYETLLKDNIL